MVFTPDGHSVAAGSYDGTVRVWDVTTGRIRATLTAHTGAVTVMAFARDGRTPVTGSEDGTVRLWKVFFPGPEETATAICEAVARDLTRQERATYLPGWATGPACTS